MGVEVEEGKERIVLIVQRILGRKELEHISKMTLAVLTRERGKDFGARDDNLILYHN